MVNDQQAALYLNLIAAKAAQLANDLKNGRLWPGDLHEGLREINANLSKAINEANRAN